MATKRRRLRSAWTQSDLAVLAGRDDAMKALMWLENGTHPEKNPIRQRDIAIHAGNVLVRAWGIMSELNEGLAAAAMNETPNAKLPWTAEEDEALIEFRSRGNSILELSHNLLRSPAAIATRISYLVGIPREDVVDAYIEGTLNGTPVTGDFHGKVARS